MKDEKKRKKISATLAKKESLFYALMYNTHRDPGACTTNFIG